MGLQPAGVGRETKFAADVCDQTCGEISDILQTTSQLSLFDSLLRSTNILQIFWRFLIKISVSKKIVFDNEQEIFKEMSERLKYDHGII